MKTRKKLIDGLKYAVGTLANHPAYYRFNGKPVIFFWRNDAISPGEWASIRKQVDPGNTTLWISEGVDSQLVAGLRWAASLQRGLGAGVLPRGRQSLWHRHKTARIISPIFGRKTFDLGGTEFPRDRIWLAVCAIGVAIVLAAYFRWARYGLATSAAAENERATALAGYSPQLLAASTWILASVVAGGLGILVSPATPLTSGTYSLAIIPALAAALIGRLRSIGITAAAGLCLGAFQSVVTFQTGKPWWPKWAITGLSDAVPFILDHRRVVRLG